MFTIKFLLIGVFFIISNNNLALSDVEDRQAFFEESGRWLKNVGLNIGEITTFVVKVEWLPAEDIDNPQIFDGKG